MKDNIDKIVDEILIERLEEEIGLNEADKMIEEMENDEIFLELKHQS